MRASEIIVSMKEFVGDFAMLVGELGEAALPFIEDQVIDDISDGLVFEVVVGEAHM